ncbi:MAG: hypothetical protein K8S22_16805 [Betaproteobacteria bacterium]|nr:hypothetical protein [Betaproteobacteria bacterium]
MDLKKDSEAAQRVHASPEQLRYARVLDAGMKLGLGVLVAGFLAYVFGLVPALVPLAQMPGLWTLAAPEYLRATGAPQGWGWLATLGNGDAWPLVGIAILSGVSLLCFIALLPLYAARRDWVYLAIAVLEIGVLSLAASGVLTVGH